MKALQQISLPRLSTIPSSPAGLSEQINQKRLNDNFQEISDALADIESQLGSGGSSAITPESIGAIPEAARGAASGVATLNSSQKVEPAQASSVVTSLTASRALTVDDAGKFFYVNSTSAITITVPTNASAAFPIGTEIEFVRWNTGAVTFAAESGANLFSLDSAKSVSGRYGVVCLKKTGTNTWLLAGALG